MSKVEHYRQRLKRQRGPSIAGSGTLRGNNDKQQSDNAIVDCGWGRLIFAHTYTDNRTLADVLLEEHPGKRDIAFYVRDPHVLLALEPQALFLDPSHTYRLWLDRYRVSPLRPRGFTVRLLNSQQDAAALHALMLSRNMVSPTTEFMWQSRTARAVQYFVAADNESGEILGAATGLDHVEAFQDIEEGSSLWALAVDPQARYPGVGQALVRHMIEFFLARGRSYLDLSVMHDNRIAIRLYERLGFERINVFAVKNKNSFNEPLFTNPSARDTLNPYAAIIVREAQRRGIGVKLVDAEAGYFELSLGGRTIKCRESLSDLTSAVAMSRCDDKAVTHRLLHRAGLRVPEQVEVEDDNQAQAFLEKHSSVVVKPARGEQGAGISVGVRNPDGLRAAVEEARSHGATVLLEEYVEGQDLRVIVIGGEVVAAALRKPPHIIGTGQDSVRDLIEKQSRRRQAATDGESRIPIDRETERCVEEAGFSLGDILPYGRTITVRKAANLHTGGTIHDVTDKLSTEIREAAVLAAETIDIPVTGLDFIVSGPEAADYVIIEANERPGLANHEPQPTAQRFIDLLFPGTASP